MALALDDRVFESGTPLTEEERAANVAHFTAKGYAVETTAGEGEEPPKPADAKKEEPSADAPKEEPQKAATTEELIDAETLSEWQTDKNDGEKLGRWARKNAKIRELTAKTQEYETKIKELESRVAVTPPAVSSAPLVPPPVETPKKEEPKSPEPVKAKDFDKPEPKEPELSDFSEAEDPMSAWTKAMTKYTRETLAWEREKQAHEQAEATRIEQDRVAAQEQDNRKKSREDAITERFKSAKTKYSDFDQRTQAAAYSPVLRYLLVEALPDGMDLAYELAANHTDLLNRLNEKTKAASTPEQINSALIEATNELAEFRVSLKAKPAEKKPEPEAKTTPSSTPPRREDPAPTYVRGRQATPGIRPEDVDPMDSDARRAARRSLAS